MASNSFCTVWNSHRCEVGTTFVFANRFISEIYFLNGRKVVTLILQKTKKWEDLTFLTLLNRVRIQQASANLQQVIEELLNWS